MSINELVEKSVKPYKPDKPPQTAVIMGILGLWSKNTNREDILVNDIYRGLDKVASVYPQYFPIIRFFKSGGEPHSNEIEDILFSAGVYGVISMSGPKLEYCSISKSMRDTLLTDLKKIYGRTFLNGLSPLVKEFSMYVQENKNSKNYKK